MSFNAEALAEAGYSDREIKWIWAYTSPGVAMYNAAGAARAAGFRGSDVVLARRGYDMRKNPRINRAVRAIFREAFDANHLTIDKVITDLELQRQAAIAKGDINAANKSSELQGKYLKMFADRVEHVHSIEEADETELVTLLTDIVGKLDGVDFSGLAGILGDRGAVEGSDSDTSGAAAPH